MGAAAGVLFVGANARLNMQAFPERAVQELNSDEEYEIDYEELSPDQGVLEHNCLMVLVLCCTIGAVRIDYVTANTHLRQCADAGRFFSREDSHSRGPGRPAPRYPESLQDAQPLASESPTFTHTASDRANTGVAAISHVRDEKARLSAWLAHLAARKQVVACLQLLHAFAAPVHALSHEESTYQWLEHISA